jgi:hypothetical protein
MHEVPPCLLAGVVTDRRAGRQPGTRCGAFQFEADVDHDRPGSVAGIVTVTKRLVKASFMVLVHAGGQRGEVHDGTLPAILAGMAYATPGPDSQVYVWSDGKHLECSGCILHSGVAYVTEATSPGQMASHLNAHRKAGHLVPDGALTRLAAEVLTFHVI